MMTKKCLGLASLFLSLTLLALLGGCAGTAGTETRGKAAWDEEGAPILEKKVVFNNPALASEVAIAGVTSSRSGDMMMAQVTLRSKKSDTLNLQYKFEWFDLGGIALSPGSGSWKPLIIYGKESKTIQGVAPDPRGREFKLILREAD